MDTIKNKPESETFALLDRIDMKVMNLEKMLQPIISLVPEEADKEQNSTVLINRLRQIENNVTRLLESVNL